MFRRGLAALRSATLSSVLVALVAVPSARAQTSELSGVVQDSSHAPFPNATITATSEDNAIKWTTKSNHEGYYTLPFLKPVCDQG
jgi:Carboxypeptidase regulatory-like domain